MPAGNIVAGSVFGSARRVTAGFTFAVAACLVAALASWSRGARVVAPKEHARDEVVVD